MSDILGQLSQLFLQSSPTLAFVFVLLVILDPLLFRPIIRVLKRREEETVGALARAREQAATAEAKSREYEAAFQAARQASYHLREEERRAAMREREEALQKARQQMDARLKQAQASLQTEVEATKKQLAGAYSSLATEITETVLSNGPSAGRTGGART